MNTQTQVSENQSKGQKAPEELNASYMAHELRAPLTAISLTLEILKEQLEGKLQADERQILNIAIKNTGRLGGLINDIMDYSKIQAGKIALQAAAISPASIIKDAADGLKAWSLSKGVRMFSGCQGELLPNVLADGKRIIQILTNLLSNAIKFTPEGGRVEIDAELGRRDNAGYVVFSVKDSGCGIPKKDFDSIFRCFEQSSSGAKSGEGTGLGLTLAKAMVEAHGGRIWVESIAGMGSTFFFTIPTLM